MLFIKTSKCFTVHCSFTLPVGAGAVIPVSEGSDGGHRWPVGVAAHKVHRACPDYITAFILTNGISWWGIPRVMGIKIPGPASTRRLPCGAQQICCTCRDFCSSLYISRYTKKPQKSAFGAWFMCVHTQNVRDLSCIHPGCAQLISASPRLDPVESDTICNSMRGYQMMERWETFRPQRQHWMLTFYPAWLKWHCWICFGVSRRYSQSRRKRTEWEILNLGEE